MTVADRRYVAGGRLSARPWRRLRLLILERDGYVCGICGRPGANTVDHVRPRCHGGSNHPGNLRAAHAQCNYGRRERTASHTGQPVTSRAWL